MEKTKLGISVNLLAALTYLSVLISGNLTAVLLIGYILLMEQDSWLRKSAVKAIVLSFGIGAVIATLNLLPDFLFWLNTLLNVFTGNLNYGVLSSIVAVFTRALDIIKTILLILLGLKALKHQDLAVAKVDQVVNQHM